MVIVRTRRAGIVLTLAALGTALSLGGCLESDVLVSYVHDQDKGEVDSTRAEKLYIPDENAALTMKDVATQSSMSVEDLQKALEDQAVHNADANTDEHAEETDYIDKANSLSTARKKKPGAKGGKTKSGDKSNDDDGTGAKGDNDGSDLDTSHNGNQNSSVDASNNVYDSSYGNLEDLPTDLTSVCAVGEAATITLSIGGAGTLAGSSEAYLSNTTVTKAFANQGIKDAAVCWEDDGMDAGEAKTKKIINANPDAVLVLSGAETLTPDQEKALGDAGIRVIVIPSMASDDNITTAVTAVGRLFKEATEGASVERASAYKRTVSSTLATAKSAHGGGVATYGERDYNDANNKQKSVSNVMSNPNWCVYLSDWNASATVSATAYGDTLFTRVKGVASTYTGWDWSPLPYYMSCGGTINNAAAYGDSFRTTGKRAFLQYNENQITYDWIAPPSGVSLSANGHTFANASGTAVLANGYDAYDSKDATAAHVLGQSDFNKVFVRTKGIKKALEAAQDDGLYAPVGWSQVSNISGYGLIVGSKLLNAYTVKPDASREDTGYDVIVNPTGMVGSWTTGSMEAHLEALWIAHEYYPQKVTEDDVRTAIQDFYTTFYGYTPTGSELDKVLDGSYAG